MDAHFREYLAAVDGMAETYGSPRPEPQADQTPAGCRLPSVGDFVSGCTSGRCWSGRVVKVLACNGTIDVEVGGAWLNVPATDITH